jgi:hypothetical protein
MEPMKRRGAPDLHALTDRLNFALAGAESRLADKAMGVSASVQLGDGKSLLFGKHDGVWGFYIDDASGGMTPLLKASRELRVCAAHALEPLYEAMKAVQQGQMNAVREAIEAAERAFR